MEKLNLTSQQEQNLKDRLIKLGGIYKDQLVSLEDLIYKIKQTKDEIQVIVEKLGIDLDLDETNIAK